MNRCCKSPSKYQISFNIGNAEISEWLLCEKHSQEEPLFQTHIVSKKEISN